MSRLIDADALWMDIIHSMDYCDDILEIIEAQPTIEPGHKTGKWITVKKHNKDDEQEFCYLETRCSECGAIKRIGWHNAIYCPRCGSFNGGGEG